MGNKNGVGVSGLGFVVPVFFVAEAAFAWFRV